MDKIRSGQLVSTYGVGAIVPVGDQSVMVAGIDSWVVEADVHEPRLERQLGVFGFALPPSGSARGHDVPVVRFPTWASCPECKRLARHSELSCRDSNKCNRCDVELIPSRFVAVCEEGHIEDFPYFLWVHAGTAPNEASGRHDLTIETSGTSASLSDIVIKCSCGKASTMQGAFSKQALARIRRCSGNRPWLRDRVDCGNLLRTLQRGASNVYFPITQSALSIPPWSEGAFRLLDRHWTVFKVLPEDALAATIEGLGLAEGTPYRVEDLVSAVCQRKAGIESAVSTAALRRQEFEALCIGKAESTRDQDFVAEPPADVSPEVTAWFDKVMLVKRLREVRALRSFTRLMPPAPSDTPGCPQPLAVGQVNWLPALEVQGEGVFLTIHEGRLRSWEQNLAVRERAARVDRNYAETFHAKGAEPDRRVSPRVLLIHTLAHILIDQWSLDCGYPAGSLRERLYVADDEGCEPMAGLLIYTATSDAAGSLGGIVSLAEGGRLAGLLRAALNRAAWCSGDPLCIEAEASGVDSLNLAACHACVLLPEVSCELGNLLLDRAMLVGTPERPDIGFFGAYLGGVSSDV